MFRFHFNVISFEYFIVKKSLLLFNYFNHIDICHSSIQVWDYQMGVNIKLIINAYMLPTYNKCIYVTYLQCNFVPQLKHNTVKA